MCTRRVILLLFAVGLGGLMAVPALASVQLSIAGYDINDGLIVGNNSGPPHASYTGTMTLGATFANLLSHGTVVDFTGLGSGTLNDGVTAGPMSTQLLIANSASDGTIFNPQITLALGGPSALSSLSIFGGDLANGIPGSLTGVTVELIDNMSNSYSQAFSLTSFGPPNAAGDPSDDMLSFIGSTLEGVQAVSVVLSNFQGTARNWFSISEIQVFGDPPVIAPVPEAGMLLTWVLGGSCAASAFYFRRRVASC